MRLTEDIAKKFNLKKIKEEDLDEISVTGNIDGGEGPPKTPRAFVKRTKETEDGAGEGEVLGYKKVDKKQRRRNFKESTYKKYMSELYEIAYPEYRDDKKSTQKNKINNSIIEINKKLFEIERIAKQNVRLKTETGVNSDKYWKSTKARLTKIAERMIRVSRIIRDLNA